MKKTVITRNQQVEQSELTSEKAYALNQQSPRELGFDKIIQQYEVSREDNCSSFQINADMEEVSLDVIERIFTISENNSLTIRNPSTCYVEKICERINTLYPITFTYDIRSSNSEVLKFWEPQKQTFEERFESLKFINSKGFRTIVFCTFPLDGNTFELVEILTPHCDHLIVEITNTLEEFMFESDLTDPAKVRKAEEVLKIQSGEWLLILGEKLKNNPTVWWDNDTRKFLDSKIGLLY
jgi:hypothetical protein